MTVFVYILALCAYIWFSCMWIVGGWFALAGDESLFFNRDPVTRFFTILYLISIVGLVVFAVFGTMAYF